MFSNKSWANIDTIALQSILDEAVAFQDLLDPSLHVAGDSPWCKLLRWKKGILAVCRHWHPVALPLLYRDVVLRRVGQVFAFAETLSSDNTDYRSLVRSIQLSCWVPEDVRQLYQQCVLSVVMQCPNLKALTFGISGAYTKHASEYGPAYDYALFDMLRDILPKLTVLRIYDDINLYRTSSLTYPPTIFGNGFPNLVSLCIPLAARDSHPDDSWLSSYSSMRFDKLEEISVRHNSIGQHFGVLASWHMPRFKRLLVNFPWPYEVARIVSPSALVQFFAAYGPQLRELLFDAHYSYTEESILVALRLCTSLTYFSFPLAWSFANRVFDIFQDGQETCRTHFDIWVKSTCRSMARCRSLVRTDSEGRRYLRQNVRLIDVSLSRLQGFPLCFPPTLQSDSTNIYHHNLFGIPIVETSVAICQSSFSWFCGGRDADTTQNGNELSLTHKCIHPLRGLVTWGQEDWGFNERIPDFDSLDYATATALHSSEDSSDLESSYRSGHEEDSDRGLSSTSNRNDDEAGEDEDESSDFAGAEEMQTEDLEDGGL